MSSRGKGDFRIQVDTIGFLANNLRGYEPTSILREQLQNADDACYNQKLRGQLSLEFLEDRLVVSNPSVFSDVDWERLASPNSRGKILDPEQTGEFGVGFWGCLHLTDAPVVTSGERECTLRPDEPTERTVPARQGTRIEFPYRRIDTPLSKKLDAAVVTAEVEEQMAAVFVEQLTELLLFTRAIDTIRIVLPTGEVRRATRSVEEITDRIDRLTVAIDGAPELDGQFIVVRSTVDDPPAGRHGRISAALPLTELHRGPGRAFFTFPTETETGLGFSIDGHFCATDDRRSLENSGDRGAWNDRIFQLAGRAVGKALEVVLRPDIHGLDVEDAYSWFAVEDHQLDGVARRAEILRDALDAEAISRAVIPDRAMCFRLGDELIDLPAQVEHLIGDSVSESAIPARRDSTRAVFERWGVERWGPIEVAEWLRRRLPHERTPRQQAESFMQDEAIALELLHYCTDRVVQLRGVAVVLGSDDAFYPLGGDLARPSPVLRHLVGGVGVPVVHEGYMRSWVARHQPETDAEWLREAVMGATEQLVGKQVPVTDVACASSIDRVSETIEVLLTTDGGLDGVPLALDENRRLGRFDQRTVVGLPGAGRRTGESLVRRLGLQPLHARIDDDSVRSAGHRFSVQLIVDRIAAVQDWNPVDDSRLLVEVLAAVATTGDTPRALVDQLREHRIWAGTDGQIHTLSELRLPERAGSRRTSLPLVDTELLGDVDPSSSVYATFKGLLRVDVLDSVEETVLACENASSDPAELRKLLEEFGYLRDLSKSQQERLRGAAFVLCCDGTTRVPGDVILTSIRLPLGLGDRCIDARVAGDIHVCNRLAQLGARQDPTPQDLVDCATQIAVMPLAMDWATDPGRLLWSFLQVAHDRYDQSTMAALAEIAWLGATNGERNQPCDCVDPRLSFASPLFPIPAGEQRDRPAPSPAQKFREALRIRPTLTTDELVQIGEWAAEETHALPKQYFDELNRSCRIGEDHAEMVAQLRSVPLIPTQDGAWVAPQRFVFPDRRDLWQHLRSPAPNDFVLLTDLMKAWGIWVDTEVTWRDHLTVLSELLQADRNESRNRSLAVARLRSLATCDLEVDELDAVCAEGAVPTSLGVVSFADSLRPDLPPDIVERLAEHLPVIEESSDIIGLLDQLPLRHLSDEVRLTPLFDRANVDKVWPKRFQIHCSNVIRLLQDAVKRFDLERNPWPPEVVSVSTLTVRAMVEGTQIAEWPAEAHLATIDDGPVLYVKGQVDNASSIVDAIAASYGIERGRKSTLLALLQKPTAEEGERHLDWEGIPGSTAYEVSTVTDSDIIGVVLKDDPSVVEAGELDPARFEPAELPAPRNTDAPSATGTSARAERAAGDAPDNDQRGVIDGCSADDCAQSGEASALAGQPQSEPSQRDSGRLSSPPGVTDFEALSALGFSVVRDLEDEPEPEDYVPSSRSVPEHDEHRAVVSFVDVRDGLVPIPRNQLRFLTSDVPLEGVVLFGENHQASVFDDSRIQIVGGAGIYQERLIVPGTIVWLHPSSPGKVEVEVREHRHKIDGVWMLELDESGQLDRIEQRDIELIWETDDAFYRAERRFEDIEALMKDVGKSALQLVIEAFLAQEDPSAGLTADQVWGLVAINRLFAIATIKRTLADQRLMFEQRAGLWYRVGTELRIRRRPGRAQPTSARPLRNERRPDPTAEALQVARQLSLLLSTADDATLQRIASLLSLPKLISDAGFRTSCRMYLKEGDEALLRAIERDMARDPHLADAAVEELEGVTIPVLEERRALLDLALRHGTAGAVLRAKETASRLVPFDGAMDADLEIVVRNALEAVRDGRATLAQLADAVTRMWDQEIGDPVVDPKDALEGLLRREEVYRQVLQHVDEVAPGAQEARRRQLGYLNWKLRDDAYIDIDCQRLRAVLNHMVDDDPTRVLNGLRALEDRAAATPGGGADAALLARLIRAEARRRGVEPPPESSKRAGGVLRQQELSGETWDFVSNHWFGLVGMSRADLEW